MIYALTILCVVFGCGASYYFGAYQQLCQRLKEQEKLFEEEVERLEKASAERESDYKEVRDRAFARVGISPILQHNQVKVDPGPPTYSNPLEGAQAKARQALRDYFAQQGLPLNEEEYDAQINAQTNGG